MQKRRKANNIRAFYSLDISLNLVTDYTLFTFFDLITSVRKLSKEYLQQVRIVNGGRLLFWTPDPFRFWLTFVLMLRLSSPGLVLFPDFEFRTSLGSSIFPRQTKYKMGLIMCQVVCQYKERSRTPIHSKKCNVCLPYVKHALNVRYKTYVKRMDRAPYV